MKSTTTRQPLDDKVKRLVIKLGTAVVTAPVQGIDEQRISALAEEVAALKKAGKEVIIVSSGAIGAGIAVLGLRARPTTMPKTQAAAAVGQSRLMHAYEQRFQKHGLKVAQVLLTAEDLNDRHRYLNARNTLMALLAYGVVPIVNENDSVAVDEIRFGDNDMLSALVTNLAEADLLVLLSDIPGLCRRDPRREAKAERLSVVKQVTPEITRLGGGTGSETASGGMTSKIAAAQIVTDCGEIAVIADGREKGVLRKVLSGEDIGTLFLPREERVAGRKRWIAFGRRSRGTLTVDAGARRAIESDKKSLLPTGVIGVTGSFQPGDAVSVCDASGEEFARGLVNYSAEDVATIKGKKTNDIRELLGTHVYDEIIHRDNMTVLSRK